MARLQANFVSDLLDIARQRLTEEWGTEATRVPDEHILISFFDSLRRRPIVRPRTIWGADDFHCPDELAHGWEVLRKKILSGNDFSPHLGREHSLLTNQDGLLNEWGVHHLHLGTRPHFKDPAYMSRTGPLLLALITDNDFYAINVYPHRTWETTSIVESLHRNWPHVIRGHRINGIQGEILTDEERRKLRRSNVNTLITMNDGVVYGPIGGGVASSGVAVEAVIRAARLSEGVKRLQAAVQEQLGAFIPELKGHGYADGSDIKATLLGITPQEYQVLFPEYGVLANVRLDPSTPSS